MDREQLLNDLVIADPQPGELVYVERTGDTYCWARAADDSAVEHSDGADAWMFYSWQRRLGDHDDAQAMLDDLLDEMETMTGCVGDRCRWSLDDPWPRTH